MVVLTTFADDASIAGALAAGARGYLTKDAGRAELAAAIRSAASGQATFGREVGARIAAAFSRGTGPATPARLRERLPAITEREAEVLALMVEGLSNPEIAERLFVSVATVKSHVNTLFAKLGVSTRAKAIARATSGE